MGFSRAQVSAALEKNGFDEDKALDNLLGGWSINAIWSASIYSY